MSTSGSDHLLTVEKLAIRLPDRTDRPFAVRNVSFSVGRGEVRCIVGESGSGKSLTARAIMGLLPHHGLSVDQGTIRFADKELTGLSQRAFEAVRGRRIGMVFQEPMTALNPLKRVGDQLAETFEIHGLRLTRRERDLRVHGLLEEMNIRDVERIAAAYPFELSGGQRQRVVIAIACALEPELLIADEPTTALDVTTQKQILALFEDIRRRRNMGMLLITHDFGVVAEIADTITVMKDGEVVEAGNAQRVMNAPAAEYTANLLDAVPKFRRDRSGRTNAGDVALQVQGLTKRYHLRRAHGGRNTLLALDQVSLSLKAGEALGVVGESGSGKSTLGRSIVGLETPDAGSVTVGGATIDRFAGPDLSHLRRNIQMVFQDPYSSLNPRRRVLDIITAGPIAIGMPRHKAQEKGLSLLEDVGLGAEAARRFPHEFSGGQRQRIGIARALALDPNVLIADEAVSALDVTVQAQILKLLRQLLDERGIALIFITHDMRVAAEICDRLMVMKNGVVVDQGQPSEIFETSTVEYTRSLVDAIPGLVQFH